MIALDTNVLVRYIVQDDTAQAKKAAALIESRCTSESPGFVDVVVLCELVWVLETAYGYGRDIVARVVRQLLGTAELAVASADQAWTALRAYESSSGDFADYLIAIRNRDAGCTATFTFDKKAAAAAIGMFELIK
ncbi:MAG: PIN domain-containing protein [Gammaproteobacteria bacterium]